MRTRRPEAIQEHITVAGVNECATNIIPADTVITATRVGLGKVVRVPYPAAINQDLKALIVGPELDKDYLEWWIIAQAGYIESIGSGTTVKGIRLNQLKELMIPLPPLPQQRRIVEAIELQLGRLDAAVARLQGAKARLKRYKQAVLKAAYDQFEKRPLEELTSVITKGASPSWQGVKYVNDPGQTLFVTSENVREGFLDLDEPKYVENSFNELQKRSMLKHVLLNIVGASIGRAAIYDRDDLANTNQAVCLIRTTEDLDNGFLCNYLNSEEAKTYYSRNQVDVARANLSLKDVRELPVPFAPIEQQRSFKERVDGQLGSANEMDATLDAQLQQAVRLRQAVLKRAFEGRLVEDSAER
jgi:type I restriction enzyme S subunit